MYGLRKVLFGTSKDLDEEAANLFAPDDLRDVLKRHRAGQDPAISSDQEVILFYEGQSPQTERISAPGNSIAKPAKAANAG